MVDKNLLDYVFTTGLATAYLSSDVASISDDTKLRFQPKYALRSIRLVENGQDFISSYLIIADSLDLREEFMSKIENGFDITYEELKGLAIINMHTSVERNNRMYYPYVTTLLNTILYHTIKDTPGAIDRINEDFQSLLKNTTYKVDLYPSERYLGNNYIAQNFFPLKIIFNKEEITDRYDNKLLNSEVVYGTFKKHPDQEYRYIPLNFALSIHYSVSIYVDKPDF